ncbi:MAG: hypothetical protein QHH74_15495, partial [Spirochaetota bacterium]|nr:hypothetical protein [Spirochaetota bacterium]
MIRPFHFFLLLFFFCSDTVCQCTFLHGVSLSQLLICAAMNVSSRVTTTVALTLSFKFFPIFLKNFYHFLHYFSPSCVVYIQKRFLLYLTLGGITMRKPRFIAPNITYHVTSRI